MEGPYCGLPCRKTAVTYQLMSMFLAEPTPTGFVGGWGRVYLTYQLMSMFLGEPTPTFFFHSDS